jgi:hypothetical protein
MVLKKVDRFWERSEEEQQRSNTRMERESLKWIGLIIARNFA